jgi:hypothetical protein
MFHLLHKTTSQNSLLNPKQVVCFTFAITLFFLLGLFWVVC